MVPFISVFGSEKISVYNLLAGIALIGAILAFYALAKREKIKEKIVDNMMVVIVITILFAFMTAVLFNNFVHNHWDFSSIENFISGFTFYGGFIGGSIVMMVGCKIVGSDREEAVRLMDISAVCLMIGQAVGRIGCFFGGCCYGQETDSIFGMIYPIHGQMMKVFPVQLYEAAFLGLLFIYSYRHIRNAALRYMFAYGVFRFLLEFLRIDDRGVIAFFSPSQWVSLVLIALGFIILLIKKKRNEKLI